MKKLALILAIVFAFGVTYGVNMPVQEQKAKTEKVSDEKDKKEAKTEKKGECSDAKKDKKCCGEKKACGDKK